MNRSKALCWTLSLFLLAAVPVFAQEGGGQGEMNPEMAAAMEAWMKSMTPGAAHGALAASAGTYTLTITSWMDPAAPPMVSQGTATRTMTLGGRVLEEKVTASVMGMPMEGVGQTGYDNVTGQYWATWTDNMSTGITVLTGSIDPETGAGVFEGMTSEPMAGKQVPMRIELRIEGEKEINDVDMPGPGGEMVRTMELVYVKQ